MRLGATLFQNRTRNKNLLNMKGRTINSMKILANFKATIPPVLASVVLASFALCKAQAVTPPPDGGYPGFNTAEGQKALFSLTTGVANTAVGWFSLWSNTDGSFNTGVGAGTLLFNVGNQSTGEGVDNTAIGAGALLSNTMGSENTATGFQALASNTTGTPNTANGAFALFSNTEGNFNTANGVQALFGNINGGFNTATGDSALFSNTSGEDNTAIGHGALFNNFTGSDNVALGRFSGINVETANNVICIGHVGENVSNTCYIDNIWGVTSPGGLGVFVNSDGKLGTATSSARFKEEIKPMEQASEALFSLQPVSFRYKKEIDSTRAPQFGLVAEDVEKVNPDLVAHDKEGKPYSVRYEQVNALLLNEFLKEHKKVEKLEATLEAVNARLQEQGAQIQKVTAQVDATRPLPHLVLNNP